MYTNPTYLTLITILSLLVFVCITDENAAPWLGIQFKILLLSIRKQWLLLKMKPDIWLMKWRMQRTLRKLQQDTELNRIIKEHEDAINSGSDVP